MEDIPGEEREDLVIVDVEELKGLDQETLEQEVDALKEGMASKKPDLVILIFTFFILANNRGDLF